MSVMTPSEMMSRMKYCEPSVTADAYLKIQAEKSGSSSKRAKMSTQSGFPDCQAVFIQEECIKLLQEY